MSSVLDKHFGQVVRVAEIGEGDEGEVAVQSLGLEEGLQGAVGRSLGLLQELPVLFDELRGRSVVEGEEDVGGVGPDSGERVVQHLHALQIGHCWPIVVPLHLEGGEELAPHGLREYSPPFVVVGVVRR